MKTENVKVMNQETTNANQFFDFEKERVQTLTLDQLERTHKENDIYGNPLKGIYHFTLLQQVLDCCKELGYAPEVYDLFAAQNRDRQSPGVVRLPQVEERYGERAVEAHILRRVFANIRLTDFDDEENTTNLAIAFHQKGIQAGFGNMVKICHNQCMLNANNYIATYNEYGRGDGERHSIAQVMDTIKSWLTDARQIVVKEREKIERMKSIDLDADTIYRIIGLLTTIRVQCDTGYKQIRSNRIYPLNQGQISQFTEALLLKQYEASRITAWDMYDAATNLYKATSMDIPNILPQNKEMVSFLERQFSIA